MGPETPRSHPGDGDAARRARLVANERAVRRANERIEALNRVALMVEPPPQREQAAFLCECARLECEARLDIDVETYAAAHDREDRFTIAPGHADARIERVVDRQPGYAVVEKA